MKWKISSHPVSRERADNSLSLQLPAISSEHRTGQMPAVTSRGIGMSLWSDPRLSTGSGEHQLLCGLRGHDQKESSSWSLRAWTTWLQQERGPPLGSTGIWAFVLGLPWAIAQCASSHCLSSDLHVLWLLLLTHLTANTYWQAQRARTGSGRVEDKINTKQKHVIK